MTKKKSSALLDRFLGNLTFSKLFFSWCSDSSMFYVLWLWLQMNYYFLGPWQVHSQHLKRKGFYMPKSSVIYCLVGSSGFSFGVWHQFLNCFGQFIPFLHSEATRLQNQRNDKHTSTPKVLWVTYWSPCENSRDFNHGLREQWCYPSGSCQIPIPSPPSPGMSSG